MLQVSRCGVHYSHTWDIAAFLFNCTWCRRKIARQYFFHTQNRKYKPVASILTILSFANVSEAAVCGFGEIKYSQTAIQRPGCLNVCTNLRENIFDKVFATQVRGGYSFFASSMVSGSWGSMTLILGHKIDIMLSIQDHLQYIYHLGHTMPTLLLIDCCSCNQFNTNMGLWCPSKLSTFKFIDVFNQIPLWLVIYIYTYIYIQKDE